MLYFLNFLYFLNHAHYFLDITQEAGAFIVPKIGFSTISLCYTHSRNLLSQFLLNQLSGLTNPPTNTLRIIYHLPSASNKRFRLTGLISNLLMWVLLLLVIYPIKHQSHK